MIFGAENFRMYCASLSGYENVEGKHCLPYKA